MVSQNNYHVPAFVAAAFSLISILLTWFWFEETLPEERRGVYASAARGRIAGHGGRAGDGSTPPASSWWDDYYRPLEPSLARFRERHRGDGAARDLAGRVRCAIDAWRRFSGWYGYEFFVVRAR
jgi:hypothetical protein